MLQEFLAESSLMSTVPDEVDELVNLFVEELQVLDTDILLAASMESAGNVVLWLPSFLGRCWVTRTLSYPVTSRSTPWPRTTPTTGLAQKSTV